jgi:hypothetical protein
MTPLFLSCPKVEAAVISSHTFLHSPLTIGGNCPPWLPVPSSAQRRNVLNYQKLVDSRLLGGHYRRLRCRKNQIEYYEGIVTVTYAQAYLQSFTTYLFVWLLRRLAALTDSFYVSLYAALHSPYGASLRFPRSAVRSARRLCSWVHVSGVWATRGSTHLTSSDVAASRPGVSV